MKAIVVSEYGAEENLLVEESEIPKAAEGEIVVEIKAAGVNPVDTYIRQGNHISAPPVPFTPGKDGAGVIAEVGAGVEGFVVGDRVYVGGTITGTYAEYALCRQSTVHHLPENVSFQEGAGIFVPYATAFRAVFHKGGLTSDKTILIHGASGAVGIAAIQFAKEIGAKVIGTASSDHGREMVKKAGADSVFDHSSEGYLNTIEQTFGGVDIVIEMLANVNLVRDFMVLNKFGTIVVVGSRGTIEFDPRLTMTKEATIKGMSLFNASKEEFAKIHGEIHKGLSSAVLKPFVGKEFALADAPEAHREIIESKAKGKIVLVP